MNRDLKYLLAVIVLTYDYGGIRTYKDAARLSVKGNLVSLRAC